MTPTRIEISYKTIVFTALFIIFLWLLYSIRMVLLALFIALILMSALNPLVTRLERKKIPRALASAFIIILIIIAFAGVIAAITPPFIEQTRSLVTQLPNILEHLGGLQIDPRIIVNQLGSIPGNIARLIIGTFSNMIAIFTLLVITYYLLTERANLHRYLVVFFADSQMESRAEKIIDRFEHQIGGWIRGQALLMLIIGIMTYIGLRILGVSFALPLSILAGLLEIVPNIGPFVSMVPAVIVAATLSPITALATLALYFLTQQFENNIIVPKVMQKTVGVRPLVTIISLLIGFQLAGALGMILAVPTYLLLRLVVGEIAAQRVSK